MTCSKILHLIPSLGGGGAERQLSLLVREQVRRGFNVHIATRRGGHYEEDIHKHGVEVHYLGDLRYAHPLLFVRLWKLIRTINPDIVQTWLPQMDIVGGLVSTAAGKPWILSERSSKKAFSKPPRAIWWSRRQIARLATMIVANSQAGYDYWMEYSSDSSRLAIIHNGLSLADIRAAQPLAAPGIQPGDFSFILVGRLLPIKSPHVLIRALSIVRKFYPARAMIIGDGPLRDELVGLIHESGLENFVSIMPYQVSWWGYLKTATALVNMSQYEGQPNVVLEAMAARCPLIVSDITMHREILDETNAIFVPVEDVDKLARAMISLIENQDLAFQRSELAEKASSKLNMETVAGRYEMLYEQAHKRIQTR